MKKDEAQKFIETYMLEKQFEKPICLVTYDGNVLIKEKVKVMKYDHKIDKQQASPKLNVLFAFQFSTYDAIKTGIKLKEKVAAQHLKPIPKPKDRPVVATKEDYENGTDQNVKITMRTGHVLLGEQLKNTEYNLVVNVCDHPILVYKHGILEYSTQGEIDGN